MKLRLAFLRNGSRASAWHSAPDVIAIRVLQQDREPGLTLDHRSQMALAVLHSELNQITFPMAGLIPFIDAIGRLEM